jgi:hypothetical protein
MFILARRGRSYARLRFGVGPGGSLVIPSDVDFARPFAASDHEAWTEEYCECVIDVESYHQQQLDQRWETLDSVSRSDFQDAWADYVDDEGDSQRERRDHEPIAPF